ncbi:MAG: btrR 2 [Paenibacillus sp.]|jgi:dTDP-4-amino-4,6-dideoxygalactose transaminase|nr:btrR 2 [Paenibacillus sp.]
MKDSNQTPVNAKFGSAAQISSSIGLPTVYPREMGPNTLTYLQEVVESGLASNMVARFEKVFAEAHGRKYALLTPGCTNALFALFAGLEFAPGDEIIVSPIGDYGDLCGLLFEHCIPVFCDVEADTGLISARTIEPCITERTRAILAVNFFGLPCDFEPIMKLAKQHGLLVIEDACQSILATYRDKTSGTLADVAVFSFDSEKTLGADMGGAVLTDDEELYRKMVNRIVARGGVEEPGFGRKHMYQGLALRAPQCTAATCLGNWEILHRQVEQRQQTAKLLNDNIRGVPGLIVYEVPEDRTHSYWMYGFHVDEDQLAVSVSEIAAQLKAAGIPCGQSKYYVLPTAVPFLAEHVQAGTYPFGLPTASRLIDYDAERICPNAVAFMNSWIRWSWTEKYTEDDVATMAAIIREVFGRNARVQVH